jgi:carboxypeptidase Taq
MVMHESQSLLMEMQACRSREFLGFAAPILAEEFGSDGPAWHPDNVHRLYTRVSRSLIRVDADEVTYNLHIFVRFELEQALLTGDLAVSDVPAAWNERYAADLGIEPANDAEGCLQDVHWSLTLVGYFPTYTLGNLYAAQLHERARQELGDLDAAFAQGDFRPLLDWLRERVHRHGRRYLPARLIEKATGAAPSPAPLLRRLSVLANGVHGV